MPSTVLTDAGAIFLARGEPLAFLRRRALDTYGRRVRG